MRSREFFHLWLQTTIQFVTWTTVDRQYMCHQTFPSCIQEIEVLLQFSPATRDESLNSLANHSFDPSSIAANPTNFSFAAISFAENNGGKRLVVYNKIQFRLF